MVLFFSHPDQFIQSAVESILQAARQSIDARGRFFLVLSGGSTPRPVYEALAQKQEVNDIDWKRVQLFFGDERFVTPGHELRNETMVRQTLLRGSTGIPRENVHPVPPADSPEQAAIFYEQVIAGALDSATSTPPCFDLVLLGMGSDGHTASLFPGSDALNEGQRWVVAVPPPQIEPRVPRVTMTLPVLNNARRVLFLVGRKGKDEVLEEALNNPGSSLPAARVSGRRTDWYIDASEG